MVKKSSCNKECTEDQSAEVKQMIRELNKPKGFIGHSLKFILIVWAYLFMLFMSLLPLLAIFYFVVCFVRWVL